MDELRKLQLIEVETLEEINRICHKHGLKCFLYYGTLLGAIRHNGFIPWDDDMDLAMPRDDYDKFIEIAKEELGPEYFLHCIDTDDRYYPVFIRVRRNDTICIPNVYKDANFCHNGVWVDIYPLNYANSNTSVKEKFKFKFINSFLRPLAAMRVLGLRGKTKVKSKIAYIISRVFSLKGIISMFNWVSRTCKAENAKYYAGLQDMNTIQDCYHPCEYFGDGIIHDFEGVPCLVPVDSDSLLRQIYGDYMQLPPEEQRVGHLPTMMDLSKVEVPVQE